MGCLFAFQLLFSEEKDKKTDLLDEVKIQGGGALQVETKPSNFEGWLPPGWQVAGSLVGRLLIRLCHQASA